MRANAVLPFLLAPPPQALCTEASLASLRRHYPQIYDADDKLAIDAGRVGGGGLGGWQRQAGVAQACQGCANCLGG